MLQIHRPIASRSLLPLLLVPRFKQFLLAACLVAVCGFAAAQTPTFSLTGGLTLPNEPQYGYILGGTAGLQGGVVWDVAVADGSRQPFKAGFSAEAAYIPGGIAGSRFAAGGVVETPFAPVNQRLRRSSLWLAVGAGFGAYTRPYRRTSDPQNLFIGSYLNCEIEVGLRYLLRLSHGGCLAVGASLVHNSNGYLRKPNLGLNYLQGSIGWRPALGADTARTVSASTRQKAFSLTVGGGISVPRHGLAPNGTFYPAYSLQPAFRLPWGTTRAVLLGLDLSYNFADCFSYWDCGLPIPLPLRVGAQGLYETFWGPVSLRAGLGAYLYRSDTGYPVFERVGLFYHFPRHPQHSIGVVCRAHLAHVDFIEWSYSIDLCGR